jgi:hypothetical protein
LINGGTDSALLEERDRLVAEAEELKRILSAIAGKDDTG